MRFDDVSCGVTDVGNCPKAQKGDNNKKENNNLTAYIFFGLKTKDIGRRTLDEGRWTKDVGLNDEGLKTKDIGRRTED